MIIIAPNKIAPASHLILTMMVMLVQDKVCLIFREILTAKLSTKNEAKVLDLVRL